MADLNCLSYWFPRLLAAGLPVPRTEIVKTDGRALWSVLDGSGPPDWTAFIDQLCTAAEAVGTPCFLRTGHTSGKHSWIHTCHLPDGLPTTIERHVCRLVDESGVHDLPIDTWAIRELLPTEPIATLPMYGDMPLCREFRAFVIDHEVVCLHPYWAWDAVVRGCQFRTAEDHHWAGTQQHKIPSGLRKQWRTLCMLDDETKRNLSVLASRAGQAMGGAWSVDLLETTRGWYVTDCGEALRSWHWPGCPNAARFEKGA